MTDIVPDPASPVVKIPKFPGWYPLLITVWIRITKAITAIVFAAESVYLAINPDSSALGKVAATSIGLAIISLLTESRAGVAEKVEQAKYIGAVEEQAIAPLRTAIAKQKERQ